jgi:hypothetical protein
MSKSGHWIRGWVTGFGALAVTGASGAQAQVLEIGDDGTVRTFSKPTRFIDGQVLEEPKSSPAAQVLGTDRFDQAARAEGVDPQLLRAVAWTESRGRMGAVSPKGALGIMQLMPSTAAELGVDPLDPDSNVHGGARYLARQLNRFRSVPLALAAYNAGPGAVLRWGGIPPYRETQAYVATIMARIGKPLNQPAAAVVKSGSKSQSRPAELMLIEVPSP